MSTAQQHFNTRTPERSHLGLRSATDTPAQPTQPLPADTDTEAAPEPQPGPLQETGQASGVLHAGPTGPGLSHLPLDGASSGSSNSRCSSDSGSGTYTAPRKLLWGRSMDLHVGAAPVRMLQLRAAGLRQEQDFVPAAAAGLRQEQDFVPAAAAANTATPTQHGALSNAPAAAAAPGSFLALDTRHSICSGSSKSMCMMGSPVKAAARAEAVREWVANAADEVEPDAAHVVGADPGAPAPAR
jgi:hypothetical protein